MSRDYLFVNDTYKRLVEYRNKKYKERSLKQIEAQRIHRRRWDHFGLVGRLRHSQSAYSAILYSESATLRAKQLADHIGKLHQQLLEEMKNRVGC